MMLGLVLVPAGCEPESRGCGADLAQRTELFDSQIAVNDTTDVRSVFETYKAHLALEGLPFPDGAEDWQYVESSRWFWLQGTQYWLVEYARPESQTLSDVAVDDQGIILKLEVIIHSPC
jgi:hypothetical protein